MLKEELYEPGIYYDTFIRQYALILSSYNGDNLIFNPCIYYIIFMLKHGVEHRSHFLSHLIKLEHL